MNWSIKCGQLEFGADAIVSLQCEQTADPIYGTLPTGEMLLELYTDQPLRPQKEEKLCLFLNGMPFLTQFVTDCTKLDQHRYRLRAKPRTEYLRTEFIGKIYEGQTVHETLEELFGDRAEGIDDEPIQLETLTGYISPGNRGHALEQILFATGAMLVCGASGDLACKRPMEEISRELSESRMLVGMETKWLPHYSRFELVSHDYVQGQMLKTIVDKAEYPRGEVTITFQNPWWNVVTDGEHGGEVVEWGSNYVVVGQYGVVTLIGYPWLDQKGYHSLPGVESEDPWFSHVLTVRDKTLIGSHNVEARLQELQELGSMRCRIKTGCFAESWELRVGDPVELPGYRGIITAEKLTLSKNRLYRELTVLCKEI